MSTVNCTSSDWKQVTKSNPCPLCNKPNWCYVAPDGNAVVCGRTSVGSQPPGWKYVKDASDGRPIFTFPQEKFYPYRTYSSRPRTAMKTKTTDSKTVTHTLASISNAVSASESLHGSNAEFEIKFADGHKEKVKAAHELHTVYPYSETQRVKRIEYVDEEWNVLDKTFYPEHLVNGQWLKGKGKDPWQAYGIEDAIANVKGKWVLVVEGEKCVDYARVKLGRVAITLDGSSWQVKNIVRTLKRLKDAGLEGLEIFPDHDEPGAKKAKLIEQAAKQIGLAYVILNPLLIHPTMSIKGDIVDWIEANPNMERPQFIERLEREIHRAYQEKFSSDYAHDQTKNNERTSQVKSKPAEQSWCEVAYQEIFEGDRWIYAAGVLYRWNDKYYEAVELGHLKACVANYLRYEKPDKATPENVERIVRWAKHQNYVSTKELNPAGINLANGMLKITWDGKQPQYNLLPHDPDHYYIYCSDGIYDPNADLRPANQLLECLEPALRDIFLKHIAACLDLPEVRKHLGRNIKAILAIGEGSNGKDALREAFRFLFGGVGMTNCSLKDFQQYDSGRKFNLSSLGSNPRINWSSENSKGIDIDNLQSLKQFITGDPIVIEKKFKEPYIVDPSCVCVFNMNSAPKIEARLEANKSRIAIITFDKVFKDNPDPNKGELKADPRFKYDRQFITAQLLPGLLVLLLDALDRLMREGIDYSCTDETLETIQCQSNHLIEFCLDTGLVEDVNGKVSFNEIHERVQDWYIANGILEIDNSGNKPRKIWHELAGYGDKPVKGLNQIKARFSSLFPKAKPKRDGSKYYFFGIAFKNPNWTQTIDTTGSVGAKVDAEVDATCDQVDADDVCFSTENLNSKQTHSQHSEVDSSHCDQVNAKCDQFATSEAPTNPYTASDCVQLDKKEAYPVEKDPWDELEDYFHLGRQVSDRDLETQKESKTDSKFTELKKGDPVFTESERVAAIYEFTGNETIDGVREVILMYEDDNTTGLAWENQLKPYSVLEA